MRRRKLPASLQLLDRRLIDFAGKPCGKVEDVELVEDSTTGALYVNAIYCGPDEWWARRKAIGPGNRLCNVVLGGVPTTTRIPIENVQAIVDEVVIDLDAEDIATFAADRWSNERFVSHERRSPRAQNA
jgi:sporulation protein YlmC with PRC-barrel domain